MFNFQNFSLSFVHYSRARTERYIHQKSFLYFRSARNTEFVPRFPAFIVFSLENTNIVDIVIVYLDRDTAKFGNFLYFPMMLVFNSKATGKRN